MIFIYTWLVFAVVFFVLAYNAIWVHSANKTRRASKFVTCVLVGVFWPFVALKAIYSEMKETIKESKVFSAIDYKLNRVFDKLT